MDTFTDSHTPSQKIIKRALPDLLTTAEVCEVLRIHINTFTKIVASGDLRAARVGGQYRVRREALFEYLDKAERRPPAGGQTAEAPCS